MLLSCVLLAPVLEAVRWWTAEEVVVVAVVDMVLVTARSLQRKVNKRETHQIKRKSR